MKRLVLFLLPVVLAISALIFTTAAAQPIRAQVFVFSNSRPHITVIDGDTHQVLRTADIPQMTSWTWNDDVTASA